MGNRAVITTRENFENNGIGIYVHWNGGIESIETFLTYCKIIGARKPENDDYGWATLSRVIGNFFGGTTSIGINTVNHLDTDNGDNGTYIIENWQIIDRKFTHSLKLESGMNTEKMIDNLVYLDECQPNPLGREEIKRRYNALIE